MKQTFEEKLQGRLARALSTHKSKVEIGGYVEEGDTLVVRCKAGISKYLVVLKDGELPQVYRRL